MELSIDNKVLTVPPTPGVYKFLNRNGDILYIGKAINLRSRVASYFNTSIRNRPWVKHMIPYIYDLRVIQTDNEIEALILESALIKKYKPKYNSDLKDDKSYAWLFINTKDMYPTVKIIRNVNEIDRSKGKIFGPYPNGSSVKRVFSYIRKIFPFCTAKDPTKPCFHSRIGLCPGPNITHDRYMENINGIIRILQGINIRHIRKLESEMLNYSAHQNFERAAEIRDKLKDLEYLGSKIKFNYFNTEEEYIEDRANRASRDLKLIANQLNLDKISRMECYDISNIQGQFSVGSMTVSINGITQNSHYRHFRIRLDGKANDPEMLKQVILRRLARIGKDGDESLSHKPDLILLDGGKNQLGVVKKIIPVDIFLLGITKGRRFKRKGARLRDEFWIVNNHGKIEQISIRNFQILSILRDEAHRFALSYHRKLRMQNQRLSELESIDGVGPTIKKKILSTYGSVGRVRGLTSNELGAVIGNRKTAEKIINFLKGSN